MPTIQDANNVTDTITGIARRTRGTLFDDGGWSVERHEAHIGAVLADPEMQSLLRDPESRDAMLFALVEHIVSRDYTDGLFAAGIEDAAAASAPA